MKKLILIAASALLPLVVGHAIYADEQPVRIANALDVMSNWRADQHLYVKGDVGVSPQQLAALESWLDENAPQWVVVLMQDEGNETYRAADGRTYYGMDAVEHALGHGLSNRTNFGQLEDPRTGESNGAIFVLFLNERKFSYFGSDAQDRRGLGESHWVGELDQPAFRAMRGGLRIADAVKDTVTHIDRRLQKTIDREIAVQQEEQRQRREEQRKRKLAVNEQVVRLGVIGEDIAEVEQLAAKFRSEFPEAIGELTAPPLEDWRSELQLLEELLDEKIVYEIAQKASSLQDRVAEFLNAYTVNANYGQQVADLEERLARTEKKYSGVAKSTVETARQLIELAAAARADGRFEFIQRLKDATTAADRADAEVEAETDRLARQELLQRVMRRTAVGTGLVLLGGIGVLGWISNRRRKPLMHEAHKIFALRKETVDQEVNRVFRLFERSGEVLGSKDRLEDRGYEGHTRQLSEKTFDNVDDLIVMSSEVERVMGEAEQLIHPTNPLARAVNTFSGSRFKRGLDQISGKPLKFKRDKGLPLVLEEDEAAGDGAAGDGKPPPSIELTFDDVFARFHDRSERATATLDRIETALLRVNDGLAELNQEIEKASAAERELAAKADENEYFALPALFDQLIPAAEQDFDAADAISGSDPVAAVDVNIPAGLRKTKQALALTDSLRRAHDELLPHMREMAPQLEQAGYEADWIDERLVEMTDRANQLFAQAAVTSIAEPWQAFDQEVTELAEQATRCLQIADQLREQLVPAIDALEQKIAQARGEASQRLQLAPDQVLNEKPRDPDDNLASARRQTDAIQAALHRGNVAAASEAVAQLQHEVQDGNQSIDDTLAALQNFDSLWRTRQEEIHAAREKLPRYQSLVQSLREKYAANTYVLQAVDNTYPNAVATINTHLDACQDHVNEVQRLHALGREFFQKGRVLESVAMLQAIRDDLDTTEKYYQDLDEHLQHLEELARHNQARLTKLVSQVDRLSDDVSEPRTMRPAMEFYQQKVEQVQVTAHDVESQQSARDPLGTAARIEQLGLDLEEVAARVAADRNAHAEAERAVAAATSQLSASRRLIERARRDGIPDSPATTHLVREIQQFEGQVHNIERRLQVPHDDWKQVHQAAVAINKQLGEASGDLVGELQLAGQAAESLESASRAVFEAAKWTGGWGVQIFGSPGSRELERGRAALQEANYNATVELSRAAQMVATHAIQKAQREVARRQRDQLRRAETRRRQRSISSGGIGWSGGRSGGSGRISSGRSSSGGNSGFSRSGW